MSLRTGIHGLGRRGRLAPRTGWPQADLDFALITDPGGAAVARPLRGILGVEERPLVSSDVLHDPRSAVVDARSTLLIDHTQVTLCACYDNEWGHANRVVELVRLVGGLDAPA